MTTPHVRFVEDVFPGLSNTAGRDEPSQAEIDSLFARDPADVGPDADSDGGDGDDARGAARATRHREGNPPAAGSNDGRVAALGPADASRRRPRAAQAAAARLHKATKQAHLGDVSEEQLKQATAQQTRAEVLETQVTRLSDTALLLRAL